MILKLALATVVGAALLLTLLSGCTSSKPSDLEALILKHKLLKSQPQAFTARDYETCFYLQSPKLLAGSYCLHDAKAKK